MKTLIRFSPWAIFLVGTSLLDWRVGLVGGLLAQITLLVVLRPLRVGWLDGGMIPFFVVFTAIAFARPDSSLEALVSNLSMIYLGGLAALSVLIRRPFTLDFSSDGQPPEVVASPLFLSINTRISEVWAACFLAIGIVGITGRALDRPALGTIATVVGLVYAIKFTKTYPDRVIAGLEPAAPTDSSAVAEPASHLS
jgi:hypothetical protein